MFRLLSITAGFIFLNFAVANQYFDGKIVGGENANIEDYPYQASFLLRGSHACGASIIGEDIILTAAHCTNDTSKEDIKIRIGSSIRNEGGEVYQVQKICQHPNHTLFPTYNDVSVLKLSSKITFGERAQAVKLRDAGQEVPTGTLATVTGWGFLLESGPFAEQLQKVEVPRVDDENCRGLLTEGMFCFGYPEGGKDSCQSDSGGPLVANGVQIGIVSWGIGCGRPNRPGIYAKVSDYLDFINNCISNLN